jgi:hypothetical protein
MSIVYVGFAVIEKYDPGFYWIFQENNAYRHRFRAEVAFCSTTETVAVFRVRKKVRFTEAYKIRVDPRSIAGGF